MKCFELPAIFLIVGLSLCPCPAQGLAANNGAVAPDDEVVELTQGWLYHWGDLPSGPGGATDNTDREIPESDQWATYDLAQPLELHPPGRFWLKKTLNEAQIPGAALFMPQYSCFRAFEIYLDNVKIYQSGEMSHAFINRHLYIKWHLIPLPLDHYNKTLHFRFFSDHPQLIGIVSPIYLGRVPTIMSRLVLRDLDVTILGLLLIFGGLFAGSFFIVYYKLKNYPLLTFSIMAVSAGIYILTESSVTPLMFDHTVLQSYLHYVTFFVFVGGAWAFLEQTVGGGGKRLYRLGYRFQIAYLIVAMLLDLLEIVSWDITFNAGMALLGVSIVAAEVGLLRMSIAGDVEARILCAGFGVLGLSGVWDILAGLGVISPRRLVFPWGLALLMASLFTVLILRYRRERRAAEETIRRSEERFRNLFDNAPISILEADFTRTPPMVIGANTPTAKSLGLLNAEPVPFPLERIFSRDAIPALCRAVEALGSPPHTAMESICLRQGETPFPARIGASLMPMFGLSRVVLTIEDITDEKERRSEEEAIAEERRRIAREIHDGLAQDLAIMNMKASVWPLLVEGKPEQMHSEIKLFQQLLKKNIHEVRRCIFALRPVDLEELGFFEATRRFIRDFGEQNQIYVSFDVTGPESGLPPQFEPALFRIIQETLNNARKHATAETVLIHLDIALDRDVTLAIQDDGQGFDISVLEKAARNGHLGVKQMHERIVRQGGSFCIESSKDKGTKIQVTLPLTV